MLSFLKNLFGKRPAPNPVSPVPMVSKPEQRSAAPPSTLGISKPPPNERTGIPEAGANGECVTVTLQGSISKLPDPLKKALAGQAKNGATIAVPMALVREQLPKGSVKMQYADFVRRLKPGVLPAPGPGDPETVELPLSEILGQLKPNLLSRRTGQRIVEVPMEIGSPFGPNLHGKDPARSAAPNPILTEPPQKTGLSSEQIVSKEDGVPLVSAPIAKTSPATVAAPDPVKAEASGDYITLPLSVFGPEFSSKLESHFSDGKILSVRIPRALVESELKRGKLVFGLRQVAEWLEPARSAQGIGDDQKIEFPLKVMAPIIFSGSAPGKARQQIHVSDAIPDVFRGRTQQSVPAAAPEPKLPASAPAIPGPVPVLAMATEKKETESVATVGGLVKEMALLPGIDGVVAATFDGFLVAAERLDGFSHQTFAAFGPQMFNRLLQYGRELQLGEAQVLTIHFDQKPIRLFKAGRLLVVIAGTELELLPEAEIEKLAAKLAQAKS